MENSAVQSVPMKNSNKYNDLKIIMSQNSHRMLENFYTQLQNNKNPDIVNKLEGLYQTTFTQQYLDKNFKRDSSGNILQTGFKLWTNAKHEKQAIKNNGCLKDFTLTNVRQTAKLSEIKSAIEKLKGYKICCQSLGLFDEAELNNNNHQMKNSIIQPILSGIINNNENAQLSKSQCVVKSLEEATQKYLRLKEDQTLGFYDVLQEYPHTYEWRQMQMDVIHQQIQSQNKDIDKQKTYFLVLDIQMPLLILNITNKGPANVISNNKQLHASQICSIFALKQMINTQIDSGLVNFNMTLFFEDDTNNEKLNQKQQQLLDFDLTQPIIEDALNDISKGLEIVKSYNLQFTIEQTPNKIKQGVQNKGQIVKQESGEQQSKQENCVIKKPVFKLDLNRTSQSNANSPSITLGIDFTFNTIKNVQKVNYQQDNPWYREIHDGFNWFCYCLNKSCKVYRQLVVLNRGYSILAIHRELSKSVCPVCKKGNHKGEKGEKPTLIFRNCGFVNCEWVMRGILRSNKNSKIYADGRTYDSKLYTFQEIDYREVWHELDIIIQKIDSKNNWNNLPSMRGKTNTQGELSAGDPNNMNTDKIEVSESQRLHQQVIGGIDGKDLVPQDIMPDYMGPKQFYNDDQPEQSIKKQDNQDTKILGNKIQPGTERKGISQRNLVGQHRRPQQDQGGYFSWSKMWQGIDCRGGHAGCGAETDVGQMLGKVDQNQVVAEMPREYDEQAANKIQENQGCSIF